MKEVWSVEELSEHYGVTPEIIHRTFLLEGLPYQMQWQGGEEAMTFDPEKVTDWEMKRKCIGCGKGLPGCGLLPAYKDYFFKRKRSAGKTALYLFGFLLSVYQTVFIGNAVPGLAAITVFTVCLYDQSMRKGRKI
jgi:hypothetical protein